jgi:hypothetical protein
MKDNVVEKSKRAGQFGTPENRAFIIRMLRAHAMSDCRCQPGEITMALESDYRWQAAKWMEAND